MNHVREAIVRTCAYFDLFQFPLTVTELHRYLIAGTSCSYKDVQQGIEQNSLPLEYASGHWCVRGSRAALRERHRRYMHAHKKFARARRVTRILSRLPFVRMVAVCNSLAYHNARAESDIDFFIVARRRGVWLARFFVLSALSFARLRPGQRGHTDSICTSFFVDEDHLDMSVFSNGPHDVYLPQWVATLYPLYDAGAYYQQLWEANASLLQQTANAYPVMPHPQYHLSHSSRIRSVIEWCLMPFSSIVAQMQQRKFSSKIRSLLNKDTRVCVRAGVLKFHTNDRRELFARGYEDRAAALLEYV